MHFTLLGDELTRLQSLSLYLLLILTRKVKGSAVTVIWASPRFGHPLPKTLVTWASPVTLILVPRARRILTSYLALRKGLGTLRHNLVSRPRLPFACPHEKGMPISLGFWEGDAQNAGVDAHVTVTAR